MRAGAHVSDADLLLAIDRELPPDRRHRVERHVARCRVCAERLSMLDAAALSIDASGAGDGRSMSAHRSRLQAALRLEDETRLARRHRNGVAGRSMAWSVTAAAALIGAIFVLRAPPAQLRIPPDVPIALLTPGAVADMTAEDLCAGARPSRVVSAAAERQVLRNYHMEREPPDRFELDALITPELGGTTAPANLWPQRYDRPVWNALVKDQLERLLPQLVCSDQLDLAVAQADIARDWVAAYKKYFRTEVPLPGLAGLDDDDELVREGEATEWKAKPAVFLNGLRFRLARVG